MAMLKEQGWKLAISGGVGAVAFPSLLAASQTFLFKPMRVSYSPGLPSSLLGLVSVTVAGCGASLISMVALSEIHESSVNWPFTSRDLLLSTITSVVMFRALGGRFGAVLPSNLTRPGAFAAEWIPAYMGSQPATSRERTLIKAMGSKYGCHSCGRRMLVDFVADHQPPSKLLGNHRNVTHQNGSGNHRNGNSIGRHLSGSGETDHLLQRFYPQCRQCSQLQGGVLAQTKESSIRSHPKSIRTHLSLRPYHLFLPLPFVITCLKTFIQEEYTETASNFVTNDISKPLKDDSPTSLVVTKDQSKPSIEESPDKRPLTLLVLESRISNFPLLIVWQRIVNFLESFRNPADAFHITLWAFTVIAALGTM